MLKKIARLSATVFVTIAVICALGLWLYGTPLYELKVNINKYSEINAAKNSGWKRHLLQAMQSFTVLLPSPAPVTVQPVAKVGTTGPFTDLYPEPEKQIIVDNSDHLLSALKTARAGTTITLQPGHYRLQGKKFPLGNAGSPEQPIVLRGSDNHRSVIELISSEGLYINQPYWIVEQLRFAGHCDLDNQCEHALHLAGNADFTIIHHNEFKNFNAHIKSNGIRPDNSGPGVFPDNVQVINNNFINDWPRDTANPVTPVDVVGGKSWQISHNFIADFAKLRGNRVAYGAFLKGGSQNGLISRNQIVCAWKLPHTSATDVRIGLSLGGGGTGKGLFDGNGATTEHIDGTITDNLIANCQNDVGIYLNKAQNTVINNNIVLGTSGIDVRYSGSSATITGNTLHGNINARDGATIRATDNRLLHPLTRFTPQG